MSDPNPKVPKTSIFDSIGGAFNRWTTRFEASARDPDSMLSSFTRHHRDDGNQFEPAHGVERNNAAPLATPSTAPGAVAPRATMPSAAPHTMPPIGPRTYARVGNPFDESFTAPEHDAPIATSSTTRDAVPDTRAASTASRGFAMDGVNAVFPRHDLAPPGASSSSPAPPRAASLDPTVAAAIMRDGYADRSEADLSGWKRVGDAELLAHGLNPKDFHDTASGLRADLYRKDDQFVLNFRGTDKGSDWITNVGQGGGFGSAQYDGAVQLTQQVQKALPDGLHAVVGHSKGGGQAYLAAQVCNVECVVANPAWPNRATLLKHDLAADKLEQGPATTELVVKGEPLHGLQSLGFVPLLRPHGVKIELDGPPFAPGPHPVLSRHVRGLEQDFDQAELMLKAMDFGGHQLTQHGMKSVVDATLDRRAGELAELARSKGLKQVDHIVKAEGPDGGGFLVQGELKNPASLQVKFSGSVPSASEANEMMSRVNREIAPAPAQGAHEAEQAVRVGRPPGL
ncbi:Phospholipase A1 [Lysobacter capsici AZ78]|uniref:Phospholipase A1 n=1 Tax=Lysobacter capsici AZ78 TaxID=1444315 RepID=A0A108U5U5_9GAMM|nr:XVIPCD domain-containing protein [Lysobacter capsici]KWS03099.1 Phospholipase A1 [Lysobacter capsici AZ78]